MRIYTHNRAEVALNAVFCVKGGKGSGAKRLNEIKRVLNALKTRLQPSVKGDL